MSNPSRKRFRGVKPQEKTARVTLSCGCVIKRIVDPWNWHAKYPCPFNVGHGYQLRWVNTWNIQYPDIIRWNDGYYNRDGTEKEK